MLEDATKILRSKRPWVSCCHTRGSVYRRLAHDIEDACAIGTKPSRTRRRSSTSLFIRAMGCKFIMSSPISYICTTKHASYQPSPLFDALPQPSAAQRYPSSHVHTGCPSSSRPRIRPPTVLAVPIRLNTIGDGKRRINRAPTATRSFTTLQTLTRFSSSAADKGGRRVGCYHHRDNQSIMILRAIIYEEYTKIPSPTECKWCPASA